MAGLYQLFFHYNYIKECTYEISASLLVYNPSHFVRKYRYVLLGKESMRTSTITTLLVVSSL